MSQIWETKDGRWAVSIPGDFSWPTYATQAAAEILLTGATSLGNFLNLPIEGGTLGRWIARDGEIRAEFAKIAEEEEG